MELVKPDIGLLFWMTTCFILLLILMRKYAWGPILGALREREESIQAALQQAEIDTLKNRVGYYQDAQALTLGETVMIEAGVRIPHGLSVTR